MLPIFNNASVLDAKEAAGLRDNLVEGLTAFWQGLDQVITFTNAKRQEAIIWQLIDAEDTGFLADCILNIARKVPAAAWAVRGIAEASHQLRIGAILLPKFIATVQFYAGNGGLHLSLT